MPRSVRLALAVATVFLTTALPLAAQVQTGSILVRVNDEQGAGVPGAPCRWTGTARAINCAWSGSTDCR